MNYALSQLAKLKPLSRGQKLKPEARSRTSNGHELLPGVDGRSQAARRYRDIASQMYVDQGGVERLSEARSQLIRRFAASAVIAEMMEARLCRGQEIDIAEHASLCGSLVRIGRSIGVDRVAEEVLPTLQEYWNREDEPGERRMEEEQREEVEEDSLRREPEP